MEHASGVVFHFSLFKVEVLRLVVRQARWQTDAIVVLVITTTPARWPAESKLLGQPPF